MAICSLTVNIVHPSITKAKNSELFVRYRDPSLEEIPRGQLVWEWECKFPEVVYL